MTGTVVNMFSYDAAIITETFSYSRLLGSDNAGNLYILYQDSSTQSARILQTSLTTFSSTLNYEIFSLSPLIPLSLSMSASNTDFYFLNQDPTLSIVFLTRFDTAGTFQWHYSFSSWASMDSWSIAQLDSGSKGDELLLIAIHETSQPVYFFFLGISTTTVVSKTTYYDPLQTGLSVAGLIIQDENTAAAILTGAFISYNGLNYDNQAVLATLDFATPSITYKQTVPTSYSFTVGAFASISKFYIGSS